MADNIPVIREDRLAAGGEDRPEETHRAVRIIVPIGNVAPAELATVVLRGELHRPKAGERLRNERGEDGRGKDDRVFVRSREVVGVEIVANATTSHSAGGNFAGDGHTNIRTNPNPGICGFGIIVPRHKRIDQVEEVLVSALHTQRGKQFIYTIAPPEVFADRAVGLDDGIAGFVRHDRKKHRSAIHAAISFGAGSVTDKGEIDPIQDTLGQLNILGSLSGAFRRVRKTTISLTGNPESIIDSSAISRLGVSSRGSELVFGNADVLVAIPFNPDFTSGFRQDLHDVAELLLALQREAKVIQRHIRRVEGGVLQAVGPQGLAEFDSAAKRGNSVSGVGGITVVSRANDCVAGETLPVGFEVAVRLVRQGTLVDHQADRVAHFIGPSILLDQFQPRGGVDSLAVDIRANTSGFFNQQLLDFISSSHCSSILSKFV